MTLFWILVGLLIVLAVIVVIWPLLPFNVRKLATVKLGQSSKNVEIFKQRLAELEDEVAQGKISAEELVTMKRELEKTVLIDVVEDQIQPEMVRVSTGNWLGVGLLSLLLIGTSLGLYSHFGASANLEGYLARSEQASQQQTQPGHTQAGASNMNMAEAAVRLEEKLAGNPDDKQGWSLLAMTYRQLGSFRKSADAFKHLVDLIDNDDPRYAAMLGSYAQSLYIAEGEKTTPEVQKVMDEALLLDPLEPSVLSLSGAELFAKNDFEGAIQQWEKALQKAEKPQVEQYLQPAIAAAKERLGMPMDEPQTVAVTANGEVAIKVRVDIAAGLKDRVRAGQAVFIFARPVGGRMPAAATRLLVEDLPTEITLTDAMSPMPTAKLSSFKEVEITARISNSGRPEAQDGDLFVTRSPVSVVGQSETLDLTIDQIIGAPSSAKQSEDSMPVVVNSEEGIALRVDIAAELKSKTQAEQTVFIFARPVGGRMPAAVKRLQVKDLPVEITLTDAMSPMPTAKLSLLEEVEITVRVSNSGQLMAQPGDLFVTRSPVAVKGQTEPLELIIDQVVK